MIKIASLLISSAVALSVSESTITENEKFYNGITESDYGYSVLYDEIDLLDDIEEKNIYITIVQAVQEKDISIGVVATSDLSNENADQYYSYISDSDPDFAIMLFNKDDYSFYFYGSAVDEFTNDDDAFWITESYFEQDAYFITGLQFPLDIQYHVMPEIIPEETTDVSIEDIPDEDSSTESTNNGIYTYVLKNGYTALLHDLDNSLTFDEEDTVLTDIAEAVSNIGFNIGIVITDDIGSDKSDYGVMDFADVYYEEYCGQDTPGILLLINNDNKYDWISTSGKCIDMFYDKEDDILDALYSYLVDGNYNYACQRFVQEVKYYSGKDYESGGEYHFHFDSSETEGLFTFFIAASFVAFISITIFLSVINANYKMKKNVTAANYKLLNSLSFSEKTDTFIRTYTTKRTVSSSSSSGSRRSGSRSSGRSHRSSRGGRHGGGGRRR